MVVAGRQGVKRPPRGERNGREPVAHLGGGDPPGDGVAHAELSVVVLAPALDVRVVEDCARVVSARGHLDGGSARAKVDRSLTSHDTQGRK